MLDGADAPPHGSGPGASAPGSPGGAAATGAPARATAATSGVHASAPAAEAGHGGAPPAEGFSAPADKPPRPPRKRRSRSRRRTAPGHSPGTLVPDPEAPRPIVRLIAYGAEAMTEIAVDDPARIRDYLGKHAVTWVNVDGLGDARTIARIGEVFGLHPLALEDVVNVDQRPKLETYGPHLFLVARMVDVADRIGTEQLSVFLGENFVVTFQERTGDCFDPVRARIRNAGGRLRHAGPDYLTYAILDSTLDAYFPVLETFGERLEDLEDEAMLRPQRTTLGRVHGVKRDLLTLRRALWPQREALGSLLRDPNPLVKDDTRVYLRDCYDHTVQLIDLLENFRDISSGLTDVYLSSVSNRMNEIMKVLTIISTIFMPLSFIAGVYGMNFDRSAAPWSMPELGWRWGYPLALLSMAATAGAMLVYFWRKGWFAQATTPPPAADPGAAPRNGAPR